MKKAVMLSISLLLAVWLAGCSAKPQEFKSEAGRFSIKSPVALQESTQAFETQAGKVDLYLFAGKEGDTGYFVSYCDYPPEIVQPGDPEKMLDGSRNGAVSNVNGKLVSETRITLEGYPGRELVIAAQDKHGSEATFKGRIFMVKNRLYQVMVVAPKGQASGGAAETFLKSFKLLAQ